MPLSPHEAYRPVSDSLKDPNNSHIVNRILYLKSRGLEPNHMRPIGFIRKADLTDFSRRLRTCYPIECSSVSWPNHSVTKYAMLPHYLHVLFKVATTLMDNLRAADRGAG